MHNVDVEAVERSARRAAEDPGALRQPVMFEGEWQTTPGAAQFRAEIPVPGGAPVVFDADFPPPMGGTGSAPNPLAYCFWGGLACYAMTYAQEAARRGVELRALRARVEATVDLAHALGIADVPPVDRIDWRLEVDADAGDDVLDELKALADDHCPGAWCIRNPVDLGTHVARAS
ncbi:MAG TPA: OsmC family protein [Solirubrobacteraceae bacterium]|nr:OsmC family protein [Solirubrobacteraceae bacterium]